ncbi:Crossover junction endonuclease mus81 [Cladophialophora carrionii]|uniref:Crossover junction endonuclease MUS81 n=1 Tax=Cladophialophora carrionii TaxID=86049 RepID=A0A1C1CKN6_9EURO|nr:Crossover junction endonuclease mus81 [Cladophialophora carrionii]
MTEECMNPLLAGWLKEWMDQAKERSAKSYTVLKRASEATGSDAATAAEAEQSSPVQKKRRAQPYVPKYRSGAYGLIVALGTLDRASSQAIPKADLIRLAQEHCDSSYTVPSDTTKYFTAWKSINTLESKELVCTKGHPTQKYYLSDEGWEVADGIKANEEGRPVEKLMQTKKSVPAGEEKISRSAMPGPATKRNLPAARPVTIPRSITPELFSSRPAPAPRPQQSITKVPGAEEPSDILDLVSASENDWPDSEPELGLTTVRGGRTHRRPTSAGSTTEDTIILPAGSFEVKIVLDMREVRSVTDRDYISDELKKLGITPIIRSLPLGDVLWVAEVSPLYKENLKGADIDDGEDGNIEIMLEHILERKRLDDLISSIKDGRFHEQKFRLHKSGIKNVTYLVEEYSVSQERMDKYEDAVESAMASMQVVDNFFVKQTTKLDDTISYLARMTRTLKALYEARDVNVIPAQSFEAEAVTLLLGRLRKTSPDRVFGMTFSVFSAMCDKSESMTLRDVYLKMLMCIRGVTGEKAVEIQRNWPTPRALAEAYEGREQGAARDSMISDRLGNVIPRKKVAKTLSAKIAEIWA